jgi:drug/metabolite transporter (DMT)-like permease
VIRAYRHASVSILAPFEYTALLWGAIFGWALWRDEPELPVWIGAGIIALASFYVTRREAAVARAARAAGTGGGPAVGA